MQHEIIPTVATVAREPSTPSGLLALTELPRAMFEYSTLAWAAPWLMTGPRGDGHPVLVLPGFIATDTSTGILRRYLSARGLDARSWTLGRNLGPRTIGREGARLIARLEEIHAATGQRVSVVGWSLGGVMARLLARWRPALVRQVITLGSPFAGDPRASNIRQLYEALTGERLSGRGAEPFHEAGRVPADIPTTAIFTKGDGVVAWQNCYDDAEAIGESIEVYGSHCGLAVNPAVLHAVADRLAQPDGAFTPFERRGIGRLVYPAAMH